MTQKKSFLVIFVLFFVFGMSINAVSADFPTKPMKLLIPFGAGGSADTSGRAIATATKKHLGQTVVVVNRPGAGGAIMYSALKNAKANGYSLGWSSTGVLTVTNIGNVPFMHDAFEHVCRVGYSALPIAVRADAPWKTFKEFIEHAKKNPGKLKVGNAGTGSATHMTPIVIEKELGLKLIHVPLGAKRRVPSLLGGEVDAICVPLPEIAPQVRAGKARVLIIPSAQRDPGFPDVPTLKEMGYDIAIELFRGIAVPKGTPAAIVTTLEAAFKKGAQEKSFVDYGKKNGFNVSFMGKAEFDPYVAEMNQMIAKIMAEAGLKKK